MVSLVRSPGVPTVRRIDRITGEPHRLLRFCFVARQPGTRTGALSGLRGSGAREWPSLALAQHDTAGQFDWLWRIYVWTMVGVFVLVAGAILFAALRYRRRDDRRPAQPTSAPRLEGAYIGVIGLIVIALITVSFRTENQIDPLSGNPALRVDVTAFQWQWRFSYPASGISLV